MMATLWYRIRHPVLSWRAARRGHNAEQAPHVGQRAADDGGYSEQTGAEARRRRQR